MTDFFRFPHTPHVTWLGETPPRDDKVLDPAEVAELLSAAVVIEEKIDGANLGFSVTEEGSLRCQNRGTYLTPENAHPQFKPLWRWLAPRQDALVEALWPNLMIFGEWCHALHSVEYDHLPDWYLAFDVYDREAQRFWSPGRRDALLAPLGIYPAPHLAAGHLTLDAIKDLLGPSRLGAQPMEGLVVRHCDAEWTLARAKLVRASFIQAIDTHWSRGPLRLNRLADPGVFGAWPTAR